MSTFLGKYDRMARGLGVAQLVARSVRDAEVVSSSLITQTSFVGVWRSGSAHAWGA